MTKLSCRQIQAEANAILASADYLYKILTVLQDAVPIDLDAISEDEMNWSTKPSEEFFLHGALMAAREGLEEAIENLERASTATPEAIEERWRQLCESRSQAAEEEHVEEASGPGKRPLRTISQKSP